MLKYHLVTNPGSRDGIIGPFPMRGAIDLHVHCGPEGIPRKFDAIQLAEHVEQSGMATAVMKSHFGDTSGWAQMAFRQTGVRLCGAVTLNHYVGGLNPMAVRAALGPCDDKGAFLKVVWLPTIHADAHLCVHCAGGDMYDIPAEWAGGKLPLVAQRIESVERISLRDTFRQDGLREILDLVAEHDLVLATGHSGRDDIIHVFNLAKRSGVRKFLITHARYNPPNLNVDDLKDLVSAGAFAEFCYILIDLGLVAPHEDAHMFSVLDPARIILSTDVGQIDRVAPAEALQKYSTLMHSEGVPTEQIRMAMIDNPRYLLGLCGSGG